MALDTDKASKSKARKSIDAGVGIRIRLRRKTVEVSQENLADHLGVSFQQVQKYEKGANRVSASVLVGIADALQTSVGHLVGEIENPDILGSAGALGLGSDTIAFLMSAHGIEMALAFAKIPMDQRQPLLALMRSMAVMGKETPE